MTPMPEYLIVMSLAHVRSAQDDQPKGDGRLRRTSLTARSRAWLAAQRGPVSAAPQAPAVPTLRDYPYRS